MSGAGAWAAYLSGRGVAFMCCEICLAPCAAYPCATLLGETTREDPGAPEGYLVGFGGGMGGSYALTVLGRYNALAREGSGGLSWTLNDVGTAWGGGGFTGTEYGWYPDRGTEDAPPDIGWYGEYTAELSWGGDKGGPENMEELPTLVGCCTVGL